MATAYHRPTAAASNYRDDSAPDSVPISRDTRPNPARGGRKLLDQFRDKIRALHYALATEKAYRHWTVELLKFHRVGDDWQHPATLGKPEVEAFHTHLATDRNDSAKTQNQASSAILFLYKQVLQTELPTIDALRAKRAEPVGCLGGIGRRLPGGSCVVSGEPEGPRVYRTNRFETASPQLAESVASTDTLAVVAGSHVNPKFSASAIDDQNPWRLLVIYEQIPGKTHLCPSVEFWSSMVRGGDWRGRSFSLSFGRARSNSPRTGRVRFCVLTRCHRPRCSKPSAEF
jgi:hypothetical protein